MPLYILETGFMTKVGDWQPGTYSATFEAPNLTAARVEVDRRSQNREIPMWDSGNAFRVYNEVESSWRPVKEVHEDALWS